MVTDNARPWPHPPEPNTHENTRATCHSTERGNLTHVHDEDTQYNTTEYPNASDDPKPPAQSCTPEERADKLAELRSYSDDMFKAYQSTDLTGEDLWSDFLTAFRPYTIRNWSRPQVATWIGFLTSRDIFITKKRDQTRWSAIVDLLYRPEHIPVYKLNAKVEASTKTYAPYTDSDPSQQTPPTKPLITQLPEDEPTKKDPPEFMGISLGKKDPDDDPGSSSSSSTDTGSWDRKPNPNKTNRHRKPPNNSNDPTRKATERSPKERPTQDWQDKSMGIQGLMKAYTGKKLFSGEWSENLNNDLKVYDTLTAMCQLTPDEKRKGIPVMLTGNAFDFFAENADKCKTLDEAKQLLEGWYNNSDKKARVLMEWQKVSLSLELRKNPNKSEVEVFNAVIAKLTGFQKQLDADYQRDRYLRDRLLTAIDIPSLQDPLRDRLPRTAQQAIQRTIRRLSDKPKTAGTLIAHVATPETDPAEKEEQPHDCEAHYSLGQKYGGQAQKPMKTYGPKHADRSNRGGRRLKSGWMRGVKGCFVCGRNHLANDKHPREEVTAAIRRLKENHPAALLSTTDLDAIQSMCSNDNEEPATVEDDVQWADDDDSDDTAT